MAGSAGDAYKHDFGWYQTTEGAKVTIAAGANTNLEIPLTALASLPHGTGTTVRRITSITAYIPGAGDETTVKYYRTDGTPDDTVCIAGVSPIYVLANPLTIKLDRIVENDTKLKCDVQNTGVGTVALFVVEYVYK
jgi:hypothetical protein